MKKRTVALLLAMTLVLGGAIGGTLAWLMDSTNAVENTFVVGQIGELTLVEDGATDEDQDGTYTKSHIIVPGKAIKKDPKVTFTHVTASDDVVPVDTYVFVKIETTADANGKTGWIIDGKNYSLANPAKGTTSAVSWSVDDAWMAVDAVKYPGVYYVTDTVANDEDGTTANGLSVIKGDTLTVSPDIERDDVTNVANAAKDITFKAYAIQVDGVGTVEDAWKTVSNPANS